MATAAVTTPSRHVDALRAAFGERRMRIGGSRIAHHVQWERAVDGRERPVPACHIGWWGIGSTELRPTRWPATCRRCRRINGDSVGVDDLQLELFPRPLAG